MNIKLYDDDIAFVNNRLEMISDIDEMVQKIDNCMNFYQNDWFYNLTLGLPYLQKIFVKGISDAEVEAIFTSYIANIKGVINILEFNVDLDKSTRVMSVDFRVQTTDGILDFNKNLTTG